MEISKEKYFEEAKEILKKYNKPAILGVLPYAMLGIMGVSERRRKALIEYCNNDREAVAEAYRRYRRKCQSNNKLKRTHKPMRRCGY